MKGDARRRRGGVFGVLAVLALSLLAVSPSIAAAETKVKTVPAEIVSEWRFNPTNPLACGALAFVKWQDPPLKPEAIPVAWKVFYTLTSNGKEQSLSATPPFNDSIVYVGSEWLVGGGAHWVNIAFSSKAGAGAADGCSDFTDKFDSWYSEPRVEITLDLKEPPIDQKKCKEARAELRERNKAVGKLRGKLRRAASAKAKGRIRERLAKARDKRVDAAQKVNRVCT